jgi:hypothetical protein
MPTSRATDILLATTKDLTAALCQSQCNPLLPPPDTQTRQASIQLNGIFSNVTKPAVATNAALPRVPNVTIPTHAALRRVPLTTTRDYLTMTATNCRLCRQNQHPSKKASSSPLPLLESNTSALATVQLPPKLQQLVNAKIQRASDPAVNPFYKVNAVLNANTGKLEEYRHLLKGKDKTLWEKGCSPRKLPVLHKDAKTATTKAPIHFILSIHINYQKERSRPIFASVQTIVPKRTTHIAYDSPLGQPSQL